MSTNAVGGQRCERTEINTAQSSPRHVYTVIDEGGSFNPHEQGSVPPQLGKAHGVGGNLIGPPMTVEDTKMQMSAESLMVILVIGLIAGWLAGQIVQGTGFGLIGDMVIGVAGAFFGSWLLPQLGIALGAGLVAAIINATIGAVILLLIIRLVRGGGGWRRNWGRRW